MAERTKDIDQDYIDYVDDKIFQLKSKNKLLKEEINTKFMTFINKVFQQQNKLLTEIDSQFDDVITQTTEQKVKIVRLSQDKSHLSNSGNPLDKIALKRVQNEIQQLKNENINIPEFWIDWHSENFTNCLEKIGKIESKGHPYTYMEHIKYSLHQSDTSIVCKPKTFEIDWPSGDVYFLNNFEDKTGFDFSITAFDRFGAQNTSFFSKFERKFCPIGMCFCERHIFVTTSGKSAKTQMAMIPNQIQANINDFKECVLKIDKSSGNIETAVKIEGIKIIGQIGFEPKDELFYIIDLATSVMNVFDLELKQKRHFQLKIRPEGWPWSIAPKIQHFQISKDEIFIVYDKKPYLEIYNLSGVQIRQLFDTFPDKYTIDPLQNIIGIDNQSNIIQICDSKGKEIVAGKLEVIALGYQMIGVKFDILTRRILFCGISSTKENQKLALVYL